MDSQPQIFEGRQNRLNVVISWLQGGIPLSSTVAAARAKYLKCRHDAYKHASEAMSEFLEHPVTVTEWSGRVWQHLEEWGRTHFDWREIDRRHRDPDRLDIAIWSGQDRLSGLALGLSTGQSIMLRFLEGDPRQDCPLRGKRILIALETAASYAQGRGKKEIRLQPINDKLVYLYETVYGFVLESPKNEEPYYRKGV